MLKRMHPDPKVFQYHCTASFPALLHELKVGLVVSTYQAGRVLLISAPEPDTLIHIPKLFKRAMGLAVDGHRLAIACHNRVEVLGNHPPLAERYPNNPAVFDALYLPRASYYSGYNNLHDIAWDKEGNLWGVNTVFSCLVRMDDHYSFRPTWQPPFLTALVPEDRCHLNGLAMVDGEPRYVTMLGKTDEREAWRSTQIRGGLLMDIRDQQPVLEGLAMPHSPRWHQGRLFLLLSATGHLAEVDLEKGHCSQLADLQGFPRGMGAYGDYLFIGLSNIRHRARSFQALPVAEKAIHAGLVVYQISTGRLVAKLSYQSTAKELFDVAVIPNTHRLNAVGPHQPVFERAIAAPPDLFYWRKPPKDEQKEE